MEPPPGEDGDLKNEENNSGRNEGIKRTIVESESSEEDSKNSSESSPEIRTEKDKEAESEIPQKPSSMITCLSNNNYKSNDISKINGTDNHEKHIALPSSKKVDPESPQSELPKKKGVKEFLEGVKLDLMNKDLLPLKILFFFKYATLFVLYPFMPLHIKSLGMSATEAGINAALIPVFVIMAPPFSGMIADKIGNFKVFLAGVTALNAPLALALLLVPKAREIVVLPELMTFSLTCGQGNYLSQPYVLHNLDESTCRLVSEDGMTQFDDAFPSRIQCGRVSNSKIPAISLYAQNSSVAGVSYLLPDNSIFTPYKNKRPELTCSSSTNSSCSLQLINLPKENNYDEEELKTPLQIKSLTLLSQGNQENVSMPGFSANILSIGGSMVDGNSTCDLQLNSTKNEGQTLCLVQLNRNLICSNRKDEKVYSVPLTFGLYTLLRIILGVASATSFIMFEGAVMAILKEHGGDYGLQRVTATLAAIIFAPLSGVLIQAFGSFYPAFYLYAVLQVVSAVLTLKIDLTFKRPTEKILGHLKEVLTQVEILIFFAAMLLSGTAWGYLESFLFWFLQDLGGSNVLMGLTISIGGLFGIPLLILSRPIIKRLGHVNVLCIGLAFYSIRLFGYSFIEDPWLCLPFEAMEAVTASLAITAAATYAAALSSSQTIASIQGIWGGLYFGFGRGAGSLMGGFFHKWYGARNTFRIFSFMSLLGGILYFIINLSYIRKYAALKRKTTGLDLNDIRGEKFKRAQQQQELSQGTTPEKWDGGYIGPCSNSEFTDIPLDEISPTIATKNIQNKYGAT